MKINIKTSIIGSTIAAMVAFCGTSQAASVFNWGMINGITGGTGAWTETEGTPGNFTVGGGGLASPGAAWAAKFSPTALAVGQYIDLTGSFTIATGLANGVPFRFALYNDAGALGTLSSGVWSGNANSYGYAFLPSEGGGNAGGSPGGEIMGKTGGGFYSGYNGYQVYAGSGNSQTLGADTYSFEIKLTQTLANEVTMNYSLVNSGLTYSETGSVTDNGGAAASLAQYDAVGFYISQAGNSSLTQFTFSNVDIESTPEPTSLALMGGGVLAVLMVRRSKNK